MRRLLVVVLALLAVPALPAGALPDPGYHAPIRVVGDEMFSLVQGISGDGSESNPYVIAGWRFEQLRSVVGLTLDAAAPGADAAIMLQDTTAFVVIKHNRFTTIDPQPQRLTQERFTGPSILLVRVANVRIEQNSFDEVGAPGGTLRVLNSTNVGIVKNVFETKWMFDVRGSSATITSNVGTITTPGGGVGVSASSGVVSKNKLPIAFSVGSGETSGPLVISDNDFLGGVNAFAPSNRGPINLMGNRISKEAILVGQQLFVTANTLTLAAANVRVQGTEPPVFDLTNTINGQQMILVGGTSGTVIDSAVPVGWLWLQDADNVTLKHVHLDADATFTAINVNDVTIEDSSFGGWFDLFAGGTLSIERTTLNGGFIASEGSNPAHIRLIDVTSLDELIVGLEGDTIDLRGGTYHASEWGLAADIWHDDCDNPGNIQDANFVGEEVTLSLGVFCDEEYALNVHGISLPADGALEMQFGRVDARHNWWGSPGGPTLDEGPTNGAQIWADAPEDVLYDPWLTSAP